MKLIKASSPSWEKTFDTKEELVLELTNYICGPCQAGYNYFVDDNGELAPEYVQEPIDMNDLGELLSTSCGCEFFVEE